MQEDGIKLTRRLAAIFYADVEGYTRLIALDEVGTHRTVVSYLQAITDHIEKHGGRVGHYAGDAVLADFDSVESAVRCSIEIQEDLANRNARAPADREVQFRIGINFETVIVDHGAVHGGGVNLAARIEALAEPGGICLSGSAFDQIKRTLPIKYEFLGEKQLKNLARPVRAYRLLLDLKISRQSADDRNAAVRASSRPVIVVLPFENLRHDPDDEYLCDGLAQDITTDLAKFHDILVISAKNAYQYKDKPVDPKNIGLELGARYLLTGSVLRSGETIRVNANLVETITGLQLWSERFDRNFSDLLATQDELVRRVVSAISTEVGTKERATAIRTDPQNVSAYDAFLRGNYHWWRFTNVDGSKHEWIECQKWFERASELDPDYPRPWAWLAYSIAEGYRRGWCDSQSLANAEQLAKQAVRIGMKDYDAHWALGYCYRHGKKFEQSIGAYSKAYELNPNDPDLIIEMAETLTYTGKHEEAVAQLERSMSLQPQCAQYCRSSLAWALYFTRRYGDAILQLSHISSPSKDDLLVMAASHARSAESYANAGQAVIAKEETNAAERTMREIRRTQPDWTVARERSFELFEHEIDNEHWLDGLLAAGLPEQ